MENIKDSKKLVKLFSPERLEPRIAPDGIGNAVGNAYKLLTNPVGYGYDAGVNVYTIYKGPTGEGGGPNGVFRVIGTIFGG